MNWLQRGSIVIFTYRWVCAAAAASLGVAFLAGMYAGLHYAMMR